MSVVLTSSAPRTVPKAPKKFGLLIMHMLDDGIDRTYAVGGTHSCSSVPIGIQNLKKLISFAEERDIPVVFAVWSFSEFSDKPIASLLSLAQNNGVVFAHNMSDPFSNLAFKPLLESFGIDTLIVGGFNRIQCVKDAVDGALSYHFPVFTTDEIMFGVRHNFSSTFEYDPVADVEYAIQYYRKKTNYFNSVDDLIHAVKLEMGIANAGS